MKILGAGSGHDETIYLYNCYKVKQFSPPVKYFFRGVWSERVLHRFCAKAAETVQKQITWSLNGKYLVVFPFCLFCLNEQNKQKGNKE